MRIVFIADIVAEPGLRAIRALVPRIRAAGKIDYIVANVENAAEAFGVTPAIAEELLALDIDLLTSGNHIWEKRDILPYLASSTRLLRPANFPSAAPGKGMQTVQRNGCRPLTVINVIGRAGMSQLVDCPFQTVDRLLEHCSDESPVVVDIHALNPGEKQTLAYYLDGRVSAVLGTHTHTQTADERVLPRGTALISDLGMSGVVESIQGGELTTFLGMYRDAFIPEGLRIADGKPYLQGAVMELAPEGLRARSIRRLSLAVDCSDAELLQAL